MDLSLFMYWKIQLRQTPCSHICKYHISYYKEINDDDEDEEDDNENDVLKLYAAQLPRSLVDTDVDY